MLRQADAAKNGKFGKFYFCECDTQKAVSDKYWQSIRWEINNEKNFKARVPIYKTITGEITYTFEAEDIEQAHDIFEKAFENGEVTVEAFDSKNEESLMKKGIMIMMIELSRK